MLLKAKQAFSWAHKGIRIEEFSKGQIIDTEDDDLIEVSIKEGWAEKSKAPSKAEQKKSLEAKIAELETSLIAAGDGEESAIEGELEAAKVELAAL